MRRQRKACAIWREIVGIRFLDPQEYGCRVVLERVTLKSAGNLLTWRYVGGIKDSAKVFDGGRWRRIRLYLVCMKKKNDQRKRAMSVGVVDYLQRKIHTGAITEVVMSRKLHRIGNEGDERNNKNCE